MYCKFEGFLISHWTNYFVNENLNYHHQKQSQLQKSYKIKKKTERNSQCVCQDWSGIQSEKQWQQDCRCCFQMSTCNCWSKAAILMLEIIRLLQVLASLDTKFLSWLPDSHKICHMPFTAMLITCCAYSCTQYSLHTQYMLLTHVNDLLCLQLHTVQSPYTVHASDAC